MASLTRWTWVWVNSGSWWWTGRPGVLRFMGSQRVGHERATELNWTRLHLRMEGIGNFSLVVTVRTPVWSSWRQNQESLGVLISLGPPEVFNSQNCLYWASSNLSKKVEIFQTRLYLPRRWFLWRFLLELSCDSVPVCLSNLGAKAGWFFCLFSFSLVQDGMVTSKLLTCQTGNQESHFFLQKNYFRTYSSFAFTNKILESAYIFLQKSF